MSAPISERRAKAAALDRAPLYPGRVAEDRTIRVVDIRTRAERVGGLGYIPGSRMFPGDLLAADTAILADAYPEDTALAIVCQSGRRSAEICPALHAAGFRRARSMQGGMLAWGAAGFPCCGVTEPLVEDVPVVSAVERFPRILAACFVASTAEHAGRDPMWHGKDPAEVVRALVAEEQRGGRVSVAVMERVLDRLAEIARLRGFPLETIQWNVDRMSAALHRIPHQSVPPSA